MTVHYKLRPKRGEGANSSVPGMCAVTGTFQAQYWYVGYKVAELMKYKS